MAKITYFDRTSVNRFRSEVQTTLDLLGKDLGITINLGNIRFSGDSLTFKGQAVAAKSETGVAPEKAIWNTYCGQYGFSESDWGKTITSPTGKTMDLWSIKPSNRKYPIVCRDSYSTAKFKMSAFSAREGMNRWAAQ